MSEGSVDVPAVGHVKKQYVYLAGAVVVGIVGYAWWHRSTAAPTDVPAYGEGDVTADGIADTAGGSAGGSANSGGVNVNESGTPATDAEWARAATEVLQGGYDVGAIQAAIGRYLTHQSLSSDQEAIVRAAIGALGYPPGGAYPVSTGGGATPSALTEPKALKQTGSTATTVTLEWGAVTGASGYRVYRSDVATNVGQSQGPKITIGGLDPASTYKLSVRAFDVNQKLGPASSPITVKTTGAKLTAPKSLTVTSTAKGSVGLKWSPVAGADGYRIYRKGVATNVGAAKDPHVVISGLKSNTTYTFYVAAEAGRTIGPRSGGKSVKTRK